MLQTERFFNRNRTAALKFALQLQISRKDVQDVLNDLTPHTTEYDLIRIGDDEDGGYLVPDDLEGIKACFSPGVNYEMSFDLDIMERGIPSFMADASVEGLPSAHPLAHFDKKFLGPETGGDFISLDDWVKQHAPPQGDLMLQMDIENAEYETLATTPDEVLSRFRIIVIEFHWLDKILRPRKYKIYKELFGRLNKIFVPVHIHPNNYTPPIQAAGFCIPPLIEVTYLRRDRVQNTTVTKKFPHPLDHRNVADKPDFTLPKYWSTA